jgi:oligosaccharyltransferase complex subunit alpha (ribophorin I)
MVSTLGGASQSKSVLNRGGEIRSYNRSHSVLWSADLPKALGLNDTTNIVLETIQTHATYPWPKEAAQNEDQLLKYDMDILIISPYHTVVQRTKIRYV